MNNMLNLSDKSKAMLEKLSPEERQKALRIASKVLKYRTEKMLRLKISKK